MEISGVENFLFIKKGKVKLNISTVGSLRNSISFNLKSGLTYRGSHLLNQTITENSIVSDELLSYKKGNTIYLLPYKQKILIPQYSQSEGYKLIIRSRK